MRKITKVTAVFVCLIMLMSMCSALFINAYAATAPKFALVETSKSDNEVTYELKLESGSFNAIDFNFVTSGLVCKSISLPSELGAGASNPATGIVSAANTAGFSTAGGTVATATFTITGASYSVDVNITNCVVTEGTTNVNVTKSVTVENGESWFIKLIRAIVNFFVKIVEFFSGLFSGTAA